MAIYSNFTGTWPPVAPGIALTDPLIRPVSLRKGETGVLFTAGLDAQGHPTKSELRQVSIRVTGRGHWYRTDDERDGLHNDTVCRGCGHHGHFDYILDYQPCPKPASHQDVVNALLGRSVVAA